jgi:hypothetical protein
MIKINNMRNTMEKQTVDEMFDALWFGYPTDLCRGKRGGKANALKSFKKINPGQKEFFRMMENMKAQIRADRKDKDAYRWPFVSTYLNQARYDDVIASESVRIQKEESKICCVPDCLDPVHGTKFSKCGFHLSDSGKALQEAWKKTGLDFKSPNFQQDCLQYCRNMGYRIGR